MLSLASRPEPMWSTQLARVPEMCLGRIQSWASPHTLCRGCLHALRQDRIAAVSRSSRGLKLVAQAVAAPERALEKTSYADGRVEKVCAAVQSNKSAPQSCPCHLLLKMCQASSFMSVDCRWSQSEYATSLL